MIDYDLILELSRNVHEALGSKSQFYKKTTELDLLTLINEPDLRIKNTEGFYNLLDQKRISDLKFASFDRDPQRKKNFLIHSLNMLEEAIKLTKDDKSFNVNKHLILYLNYLRITRMTTNFISGEAKKEILLLINLAIDSLSTEIIFLKSWFMIFKTQILFDLGYFTEAKKLLPQARKMYFENYSDFYFTFQSDFGKNYWDEVSTKLENDLQVR